MLDNWLVKRLSPVKNRTPRWVQLAEALQELWVATFDAAFDKVTTLRSIYTADDDGQRKIIFELGSYFEDDLNADSRGVLVGMRKWELLRKDTETPIKNAIQRMGLTGIEWIPLWAKEADGAYGTAFYPIRTGETPPDGAYLTSRGKLLISKIDVTNDQIASANALIIRIKPTHIVYEGVIQIPNTNVTVPVYASVSVQYSAMITIYPQGA